MFCKYCGKELEAETDFCQYCGKRLNEAKNVDPEGKDESGYFTQSVDSEGEADSAAAAETHSPRTGGLSRQWIIAVIVIVVAVVVIVGVLVFLNNRSGGSEIRNGITTEARPKLSTTNIAAANEAVSIVDRYFEEGWPSYGSEYASSDLKSAEKKLVNEQDSATENIKTEIEDNIDNILTELELNEKTFWNGVRIFSQGGDPADPEVIKECRNNIEQIIEKYS